MVYVYPTIITPDSETFFIEIPDLEICTESENSNLAEAIKMARDALGLWLMTAEDLGKSFPQPSHPQQLDIKRSAFGNKEYSIITFVDVDLIKYRIINNNLNKNRCVRKNVSIPMWLNDKATEAKINCSKVLQDALINKLGL